MRLRPNVVSERPCGVKPGGGPRPGGAGFQCCQCGARLPRPTTGAMAAPLQVRGAASVLWGRGRPRAVLRCFKGDWAGLFRRADLKRKAQQSSRFNSIPRPKTHEVHSQDKGNRPQAPSSGERSLTGPVHCRRRRRSPCVSPHAPRETGRCTHLAAVREVGQTPLQRVERMDWAVSASGPLGPAQGRVRGIRMAHASLDSRNPEVRVPVCLARAK